MFKVLFLIVVLQFSHFARAESDYFALPLVVRHEGVGGIYGLAAGVENVLGKGSNIVAGGTGGEAQLAGLLIGDVPLVGENIKWSLFGVFASEARFETQYGRGLVESDIYEQQVSGSFVGTNLNFLFFSEIFGIKLEVAQSSVALEDYFFAGELVQRPNKANYHDINTTHLSMGYRLNFTTGEGVAKNGFDLNVGVENLIGRTGQSDHFNLKYSIAGYLNILQNLGVAIFGRVNRSSVSKKADEYLTTDDVRNELDTQCSSISDSDDQARCQSLEDDISAFVASSNDVGAAPALGGAGGVRAFREFSLRGAHTALASMELRWAVWQGSKAEVQLSPFYDVGYVSDEKETLYDESVESHGIALRISADKFVYRISAAESEDESAWFATVGQSF